MVALVVLAVWVEMDQLGQTILVVSVAPEQPEAPEQLA
jgi:hypothetical protein